MTATSFVRLASSTATLWIVAAALEAWDAGPKACRHNECSGGFYAVSVPDTQPRYAASVMPDDQCPSGAELYGGVCYRACPEGWKRTAVCTCKKVGGGPFDLMTNCGRFGASGTPTKVCGAGREMYGGLCYAACPQGSTRSAVSTCVHQVKFRSNTHLWVVNRALDLLAKSTDPVAVAAAARMRTSTCRTQWEGGLWDADDGTLAEQGGARGSHFYNGAGRDFEGEPTKVVTYRLGTDEQIGSGNARTNAASRMAKVGTISTADECYQFGLALHYLTDMTQPMHASSFSALGSPFSLHPAFEDYVGNVQARFPVAGAMAWQQRWKGRSADDVFHETALRANALAPGLAKVLAYRGTVCTFTTEPAVTYTSHCFLNDSAVHAKIGELLFDAYQSTASYIYAAFKEREVSALRSTDRKVP